MPGRTRRGAPPLRRQRGALRVMQATLLALAVGLTLMAGWAWGSRSRPESALEGTTQAGLVFKQSPAAGKRVSGAPESAAPIAPKAVDDGALRVAMRKTESGEIERVVQELVGRLSGEIWYAMLENPRI